MNTIENRGKRLERFLTKSLGAFLLPDFVIANPKIKFGNGKSEELADAIVPFLEYLITMQFKSKKQDKDPRELEQKDYGRIVNKIKEASSQAKTTIRAYKQGLLKRFTNLRGIEMPIENGIKEMASIIVIELEGEEKYDYYVRTRCVIQYIEEYGLSHHIFFLDDFQILLSWNDTIGDLWKYLEFRKKILSARRLHYPFYETDLLSCYLFSFNKVMDILDNDDSIISLEMGMYNREIEAGKDLIARRQIEFSKYAWVIDVIIACIHTILDPRAEKDIREKRRNYQSHEGEWGNDVYYHLIKRIGSLNRLERYAIGKIFIEKMEKADSSDRGFNYYLFQTESIPGHGFLIAATRESDISKRFDLIDTLCFAAIHQSSAMEVTGIITDSASSNARSFQFSCTKYDKKEQSELDWHKNHRFFKEPVNGTIEVWKNMRDSKGECK